MPKTEHIYVTMLSGQLPGDYPDNSLGARLKQERLTLTLSNGKPYSLDDLHIKKILVLPCSGNFGSQMKKYRQNPRQMAQVPIREFVELVNARPPPGAEGQAFAALAADLQPIISSPHTRTWYSLQESRGLLGIGPKKGRISKCTLTPTEAVEAYRQQSRGEQGEGQASGVRRPQ